MRSQRLRFFSLVFTVALAMGLPFACAANAASTGDPIPSNVIVEDPNAAGSPTFDPNSVPTPPDPNLGETTPAPEADTMSEDIYSADTETSYEPTDAVESEIPLGQDNDLSGTDTTYADSSAATTDSTTVQPHTGVSGPWAIVAIAAVAVGASFVTFKRLRQNKSR